MRSHLPLFLICGFFLLMGCKKHSESGSECVETLKGTISLTPEEKLIHPYGLHDSLVYINDVLKDTLSFSCTIQASSYYKHSENPADLQGQIACLGKYYKTEMYTTQFNKMTTKGIYLQENAPNPFDTSHPDNLLQFSISVPGGEIAPFDGIYGFRQDTLFSDPQYYLFARIEQYYDTLTIREKLYSKVYLLKGAGGPPGSEGITEVWYSVSDGILQFSTKYGLVWELNERIVRH